MNLYAYKIDCRLAETLGVSSIHNKIAAMTKMLIIISSSCFFFICFIPFILYCNAGIHSGSSNQNVYLSSEYQRPSTTESGNAERSYSTPRKLLQHGSCTNKDISISQSKDSTPGIPRFIVQIANTCVGECAPSNIHLHCGWFASARIVNPRFFKRMSFDDCLVNGGRPLKTNEVISFTYSNSFMYPLAFKSANFC